MNDQTEHNDCGCGQGDDKALSDVKNGDIVSVEKAGPLAWVAILMVRMYQRLLSPLLPPSCRYQPTCSQYTLTALRRYGIFRGGWLGLRRIMRCHPFRAGGYDPVP